MSLNKILFFFTSFYNVRKYLIFNFFSLQKLKAVSIMPGVSDAFDLSKFKKKKEESWLDRQLKDVADGSVGKEMAIGGVTGW